MLIPLSDASFARCGGKAANLAVLIRAGVPVPDGFVVPFDTQTSDDAAPAGLLECVTQVLARWGDSAVAVRSSARNEDMTGASAAGQYESILGIREPHNVTQAITTGWASVRTSRVAAYWNRTGEATDSAPDMAVLVQRLVDAEVSGVMFTPQTSSDATRIETSWGLGESIVGGTVTPDSYTITHDGTTEYTPGRKNTRVDPDPAGGVTTSTVAEGMQNARTLTDDQLAQLETLGHRVAEALGAPQDIEWAIADNDIWILQARPITAPLPTTATNRSAETGSMLTGMPGSPGRITATARIVRSAKDFPAVEPGEIIVCPYTDPAWTALFAIASGVITETGGALSHAAIIAREYNIPAVLGVSEITKRICTGDHVTLDGNTATITIH